MDIDILQDYLPEARELLERAQEDVLKLEKDPGNDPVIASVFRAFHTLKGGAGFLDAENLVHWTHHLEDLLDKARSHQIPVTPDMVDLLLKAMDVIDQMLGALAQGLQPEPGPAGLGEIIQTMASGKVIEVSASMAEAVPEVSPETVPDVSSGVAAPESASPALEEDGVYRLVQTDEGRRLQQNPVADSGEMTQEEFERVLDGLYGGHAPGVSSAAMAPVTASKTTAAPEVSPAPTASAPVDASSSRPAAQDPTLRVDAARLDAVMNQVGELVLLRNRLASAVGSLGDENEDMTRIAREMDLTVNDIQSTVMKLRMQPCKRLFQQLPRVVRDASRQLGKEVQIEIVGEDVEIDKTVVDALSGPMAHLVRNSLDHGIEMPADRVAAGKPRSATLRVAAIHLGDKVRIEVSDDGKGIDRQFVTKKAIDKGVITQDQAARLSEQEALELIFRPGFSTKDQATDLSGRGVGMDVVRETARSLRGRLELETRLGKGTSIAMEFPLTMAVLPVLYLRVRRDLYAMPVSAIDGLVDIAVPRIHRANGRAVYQVEDDKVVPIIDVGHLLQNMPLLESADPHEGVLTEWGLFVVSEVMGNEDSVVKPVDFLTDENWYQGATISGKGNVVLILDPGAVARVDAEAAAGGVL